MRCSRLSFPFAVFLLAMLGLSLAGCEEDIVPFVEEDRYFSIYGFLDTASARQFVRVVPLRRALSTIGDVDIDATVTSTERETGETVVWRDSLLQYPDGSFGHVYYADFRPIPGFTYQFNVARSDGAMAEALTTVPTAENVQVGLARTSGELVFQEVVWQNIDFRPFRVEVWYRFLNNAPREPFRHAVVVYDQTRYGELEDSTWKVTVRPDIDRLLVIDQLNVDPDARLSLLGVGMRLTMSDDQWRPPNGVFDREVLVQPGTFSNVEGGFGFFGSVNQYTAEWVLPPDVTERLGYAFPGKN